MKKFLLLIIAVTGILPLTAQAPAGFQYQAVVRNDQGEPMTNTTVTTQFSILMGSSSGTPVYVESHSTTTNSFGLINLSIGTGAVIAGDLSTIDWSTGSYFVKTELDLGSGLQNFGSKRLLSVPFALYGEDADADPTNEVQSLTLTGSLLEISDGNSVDLGVLGADTDDQTLTLTGTDLAISEGNTIDVSSLQDGIGTDDQVLSITDNTLSLENGGDVDLSGYLDNTDAQNLTLAGANLTISGGNTVDLGVLGADTDDQTLSLTGTDLTISEGNTIDVGSLQDGFEANTDTQLTEAEVDDFVSNNGYLTSETDDQALSLSGNTLTLEDGGNVDLSAYLDDTNTQLDEVAVDAFVANNGYLTTESDDQTISLSGNTLTLEDGGTVDLSSFLDDTDTNTQLSETEVDDFVANNGYLTSETDDQALSLSGNTLTIEDGGDVDLAAYLDNTDTQSLDLDISNILSIQNANTVDLNPFLDNTDDQQLTFSSNELTLENGGTAIDLSGYLDNTDAQNLSDVLSNGADADATAITNLAEPTSSQDAATKNYVDLEIEDVNDKLGDLTSESGDFLVESFGNLMVDVDQLVGVNGAGDVNGQSFTATQSGNLQQVDIEISTVPSFDAPSSITFILYEGNGFGGTVVGSETVVPIVSSADVTITFEDGFVITSGNQYTFELQYLPSETVVGQYNSAFDAGSDVYAGGNLFRGGSPRAFSDMIFTTYVSEIVPTLAVENNSVGIGTSNPAANAILDISSTEKGVLFPRMTEAERDAISSPTTGLLIYNTDTDLLNKYAGAAWQTVGENSTLAEILAASSDANAATISNLADPTNHQDAATKAYVDTEVSGVNSQLVSVNTQLTSVNTQLGSVNSQLSDLTNESGGFLVESNTTYTLDINQPTGSNGAGDVNGQSFTPTQTGNLGRLEYEISTSFDAPTSVTVIVYQGSGFGGTVIGSEVVTPEVAVDVVTLTFEDGFDLTASQQYTFELVYPVGETVVGRHNLAFDAGGDLYAGGDLFRGGTLNSFDDMVFATYIAETEPTLAVDDSSVGIGTDTPDPSAALEVSSTSGGVLLPRMTTTERDAISSPTDGLVIYNTTTNQFQGRANGAWVNLH